MTESFIIRAICIRFLKLLRLETGDLLDFKKYIGITHRHAERSEASPFAGASQRKRDSSGFALRMTSGWVNPSILQTTINLQSPVS